MDKKNAVIIIFVGLLMVVFSFSHLSNSYGAPVIKIGMTPDLTGGTSEVGIPYSNGIKDYFRYMNDKGGVNGKKIELMIRDCQKVVAQEV